MTFRCFVFWSPLCSPRFCLVSLLALLSPFCYLLQVTPLLGFRYTTALIAFHCPHCVTDVPHCVRLPFYHSSPFVARSLTLIQERRDTYRAKASQAYMKRAITTCNASLFAYCSLLYLFLKGQDYSAVVWLIWQRGITAFPMTSANNNALDIGFCPLCWYH